MSPLARDPPDRAWIRPLGWALVAAVAVALRWRCFHAYVDEGDPCEYVWAIRQGYLPHSPYVLFLGLGRAIAATGIPADVGLSVLSLVGGLGAVALLGLIVLRQTGAEAAAWLASLCVAVFPLGVWFSGIQEVYALQAALVLAGVWVGLAGGRAGSWVSGLLFGAAFATHDGTILVAPAMALAIWDGAGADATRRARIARVGSMLAGAVVVPALAYGWLAWIFAHRDRGGWVGPWLRYLRGITPAPDFGGATAASLIARAEQLAAGAPRAIVGSAAVPLALLVAALAVLVAARRSRIVVFWTLFALPCLAYEFALGWNVDPGIYVVYVAPSLAALLAAAIPSLASMFRRPAAPTFAALAALALVDPSWRSAKLAETVLSRDAFLRTDRMRVCQWLRRHAPAGSVLVQPPGLSHVNFMPCHTGLRPIIVQEGIFRIFTGDRGTPLNLDAFPPLLPAHLDRLLERGVPVLSLVRDPFGPSSGGGAAAQPRYRWREESMRFDDGSTPERPLFVLEYEAGR